ncbi:16S rRNA (adenine(1518)-N(6)/adenine(1519)-N(6))-dimethyltransferase RsmA [Rubrobacter marinus]|uniref:16S rRNA (adenine(1518)-N(6)/adenine(1519)-N(6))- dimethyltransferase RsmA n=1 Tax=Rubrobacter marinus TaxID=2653852 RepID=UPI0014086079|nr:16S rRNA (adenine(1518)-N(6)/adenine(1519)-N(6))-dimethyltransferase RsmA [Rubrobacter marinus]
MEPPSPRSPFPKKRLGQHFLKDPNTARIVAEGVTAGDVVLEIGPGRGALTSILAERAGTVHAVELDRDVLPLLKEALGGRENVRVYEADALAFDYASLAPRPNKMAANLPYNVASPLVLRLLEEAPYLRVLRFMVQLEVARRMAARPRTKDYGAYAVLVQTLAEARVAHKVSPQVFDPPPNVWSAVVAMERRSTGVAKPGEYAGVKELVVSAFRSRRKRLVNNLPEAARGGAPKALASIGHGPDARAEELAPEDFVALYRELSWAIR